MAKRVTKKRVSVKKNATVKLPVVETSKIQMPKRMPRKLLLYAFVILVVGALIYFGGRLLFVATVNGQPISRFAVIQELEKQGGKKVLDVIVLKTVINQEAKKRKVMVTQKEVDSELAKIEANVAAQGATLDALLAQQGLTKDALVDQIKLQILLTKMVDTNIKVTDKEIDDYLASQQSQAALSSAQPVELPSRDSVKAQLKQQKLQQKIQDLVTELKSKAKINYMVNY